MTGMPTPDPRLVRSITLLTDPAIQGEATRRLAEHQSMPRWLQNERRWFGCRLGPPDANGRRRKLPYSIKTGELTDPTNLEMCVTYAEAHAARSRYDCLAVALGDGLHGVDLDHCIDPVTGRLTPQAQAWVEELNSYTEGTVSGTGLHILLRGKPPVAYNDPDFIESQTRPGLEVYTGRRFFAFTGKHWPGTPTEVEYRQEELRALVRREFGPPNRRRAEPLPDQVSDGSRNNTLMREGGRLRHLGLTQVELMAALLAINTTRCRPPLSEREVEGIAARCAKYPGGKPPVERTLQVTFANQIQMRPVHWLWDGRIPLGEITLLAGREGTGKSTVAYTLGAQLTRGRLVGCCGGQPRHVVVAATEDSWEHTIVPRLVAAGADLAKVARVNVATQTGYDADLTLPEDIITLEGVVRDLDAALVLLDPVISRLAKALDKHNDADVRLGLEPLKHLAHTTASAVLGIIHVNKSGSKDPLNAVMGSRAFVAVARAVLFVVRDADDPTQLLLGQEKNNLGRLDLPSLTFNIEAAVVGHTDTGEVIETGKIRWTGESDTTIRERFEEEAQTARGGQTAQRQLEDWLHEYLLTGRNGWDWHRNIVNAAGLSKRSALKRAKRNLKIAHDTDAKTKNTYWWLPGYQPKPLDVVERPLPPEDEEM